METFMNEELDGMYNVIDNFCDDIEEVKQSALAAGLGTWAPGEGAVKTSAYDGVGFVGNHAPLVHQLMYHTAGIVIPNVMFFRVNKDTCDRALIHSDREQGAHSAIVYLSDHSESSGTAFFKHKPSGWTHMPSFEDLLTMGKFEELKADMISRDPDKWEQVGYIEGKYNRALTFDAPLFHSRFPVEGIGQDPNNARMIWGCHFYKLNNGELC